MMPEQDAAADADRDGAEPEGMGPTEAGEVGAADPADPVVDDALDAEVTGEAAALTAEQGGAVTGGADEIEEWAEDVESSYLQSKYTLVSVAAKRARQILDGSAARVETLSEKPVTVALEELSQGKLYFERMREAR